MGLDPSHQLTEKDIHDYQLPEKIGGKWRDLARALDYSQANINRIQKDQGGSTKECCIEVLVCWRGREGRNATVEKLAGALVKAELKNVADELMCMDTTQVRLLWTSVEIKHKLEKNIADTLFFFQNFKFLELDWTILIHFLNLEMFFSYHF